MAGDRKLYGVLAAALAICLAAGQGYAAEGAAPESWVGKTLDKCCFGGDIRIRQVHFDETPRGSGTWDENHFFRFRTRLWGQIDASESMALRAEVVNEFREYLDPDSDAWEFPNELAVDALYLDLKGLFDGRVDARIGRQNLIYGTGKVILEGTPGDGSRTIYMDAAKVSVKVLDKTTVDLLAIYDSAVNVLAVGDHKDAAGNTVDLDLIGNDVDESGGGVYLKDQTFAQVPFEVYYLYKNESQGAAEGSMESDTHTLGARVMPKLSESMQANLEGAYQIGREGDMDLSGYMVDGMLNWHLPVLESMKPCVGAGLYYLSGDDQDTGNENEAWNPLWARYPQNSELYIYATGAYWSNLMMPHVDLSIAPADWLTVTAMVGQMYAPQEDGPGGGDVRGLLATLKADFTIGSKLLTKKDKLFGHLLLELLDAGDYHAEEELAHFARWELSYAF